MKYLSLAYLKRGTTEKTQNELFITNAEQEIYCVINQSNGLILSSEMSSSTAGVGLSDNRRRMREGE